MLKNLWNKYKSYVISVLIALGVGALSALLTMGQINVFETVKKPPLSPPAFLFPIVWTALYILMGISSAMIYNKRSQNEDAVRNALSTYASSLIVNFAWSIIFFNFGAYLLAFIWLLLLLALIIKTIVEYFKIERIAAYLQIPYALWVTFAGYLTLAIYILNG
ncbi:MAG: tryptophan-rich sensory protein [Clostridia bacterium]|nr:tryptophan-rich sensory protein [Clostridia bacterium]